MSCGFCKLHAASGGPPLYVAGSMELSVSDSTVEGHAVQLLRATWLLIEDRMMNEWGGVYVAITSDVPEMYRIQEYGYPGLSDGGTSCGSVPSGSSCERATIDLIMTEFRTSGQYWPASINLEDAAGNKITTVFTDDPNDEPPVKVSLSFTNPDTAPPALDIESIVISAQPTNPGAPNGETAVEINFRATDNLSGLGKVTYRLLDPQGGSHFEYHYHDNFHTEFFDGDPTVAADYQINVVLPVGSPPGTWGLEAMELFDKVSNKASYNFVELMHFDVQDADLNGR
jgi:hypothetical protein